MAGEVEPNDNRRITLGSLLSSGGKRVVAEAEWAALVEAIGRGDKAALHELYGRAHRIVFTLLVRMTQNRETAEELTVDVFHDVWRRASRYDPHWWRKGCERGR